MELLRAIKKNIYEEEEEEPVQACQLIFELENNATLDEGYVIGNVDLSSKTRIENVQLQVKRTIFLACLNKYIQAKAMTQCNRFIDNQIFCYDVTNKKYWRKHE